jgi:transcriptional regulator GlxA family with amidase domain
MNTERRFLLVVPDGGALFEPSGVADILSQANQLMGPGVIPYRTVIATTKESRVIHGRSGINLMADAWLPAVDPSEQWDTVVVTNRAAEASEVDAIARWIALASPHCRRTVSVCAGALILAKAGLLAGKRATTHWRHLDALAALSPTTEVDRNSIYVRDGNIWTSAGASSGFDLTLALVADDFGPELARAVARDLVLYLRRPGGQAQFSRFLAMQADPETPVGRVQVWALEHLDENLDIERLADRAAMSVRNFCRVFAKETGSTPARFVEDLRLEAARNRLEQGHESLDEVAFACGFGTALNLRRVFEKHLGVTPSDYRLRFGMI